MTSLDPLSRESHESKMGIRQLMEIQMSLKPWSIVAAQGLDILRNLMSLVMAKEIDNIFEIRSPLSASMASAAAAERYRVDVAEEVPTGGLTMPFGCNGIQGQSPGVSPPVLATLDPLLGPEHIDVPPPSAPAAVLPGPPPLPPPPPGDIGIPGAASDTASAGSVFFDFCENPSMAEALLDFEQGMFRYVTTIRLKCPFSTTV